MLVQPFTGTERADLLRRYNEALNAYNALMDAEAFDEARAPHAEAERLQALYFDRLPRLPVSCCPYDGKPLYRTLDPYGLDGLWWQPEATPDEVPACPHFCLLRGAVHYQGLPPQAGGFEVHPGPEVPYVIPRLLEMDGMIAVIAQIEMENGSLAYPIAYFAERRPPPQDLTAGWARTSGSSCKAMQPLRAGYPPASRYGLRNGRRSGGSTYDPASAGSVYGRQAHFCKRSVSTWHGQEARRRSSWIRSAYACDSSAPSSFQVSNLARIAL